MAGFDPNQPFDVISAPVSTRVGEFGWQRGPGTDPGDNGQFAYGGSSTYNTEDYAALPPGSNVPPGYQFPVTNPRTGTTVWATHRDKGPARWTGRGLDLAPVTMNKLGAQTDDTVVMDPAKAVPAFDPSKPFEVVDQSAPKFDPSKPHDVVSTPTNRLGILPTEEEEIAKAQASMGAAPPSPQSFGERVDAILPDWLKQADVSAQRGIRRAANLPLSQAPTEEELKEKVKGIPGEYLETAAEPFRQAMYQDVGPGYYEKPLLHDVTPDEAKQLQAAGIPAQPSGADEFLGRYRQQLSQVGAQFSTPKAIADVMSFAVPGASQAWTTDVIMRSPDLVKHITDTAAEHGWTSPETVAAAAEVAAQVLPAAHIGVEAGRGIRERFDPQYLPPVERDVSKLEPQFTDEADRRFTTAPSPDQGRFVMVPDRRFTMVPTPPEAPPQIAPAPTLAEAIARIREPAAPRVSPETGEAFYTGREEAPTMPSETARVQPQTLAERIQGQTAEPDIAQKIAALNGEPPQLEIQGEPDASSQPSTEGVGLQPEGAEVGEGASLRQSRIAAKIREQQEAAAGQRGRETVAEKITRAREPVAEPPPEPGVGTVPAPADEASATKNAAVEAARAARGLAPVERNLAADLGPAWDQAQKELASDPNVGQRIIDQYKEKGASKAAEIQNAHLARELMQRTAEYDAAAKAVNETQPGTPENLAAQQRKAQAYQNYNDVHLATKNAGTDASLGFNARKGLRDMDYTEPQLLARRQAAQGGRPLSRKQVKEVETLARQKEAVKAQLDAAEQAQTQTQLTAEGQKLKLKLKKNPNLAAGTHLFYDLADFGVKVFKKGMDFARWSAEMIKHLGRGVAEHLGNIWAELKDRQGGRILPHAEDRMRIGGGAGPKQGEQLPTGSLEERGGGNYPEKRIRTEFPAGDTEKTQRDMSVDTIYKDPVYTKKIADVVRPYLPKGRLVEDNIQQIKNAIDFFRTNKEAHLQMLQEHPWAQRAMKQYEGYSIRGHQLKDEYGHTIEEVLGGESAISPQTPPDESFSMIERLMKVMRDSGDTKWDSRFEAAMKRFKIPIGGKGLTPGSILKRRRLLNELRGKTYGELTDPILKAIWARTYDHLFHSPYFRHITPEGTLGDYGRARSGSPTPIRWRGFDQISKGIRALEGEPLENLLTTAKVSSYYNSKIAPNLMLPDWVADTHDIGSSWMRPVSGDHPLVKQSFGGPKSLELGHHGVSALHAEAGRQLADKYGLVPSDVQAGTWSHQQGFMSMDALDAHKDAIAAIDKAWKDAHDGKISESEARARAISAAREALGKANDPAWSRKFKKLSRAELNRARLAGYPSELSGAGRAGGTVAPGDRGGIAAGATEEPVSLEFSSSSTSNKNFNQARQALGSNQHTRARLINDEVNRQLGLGGATESGVGAWTDGAEDSVVHVTENAKDFDEARYAAVIKGKLLKQKSMLVFRSDPTGADAVHSFVVRSNDLEKLHNDLNEAGLSQHTLVGEGKDTHVLVVDKGNQLADNVGKVAEKYGVKEFNRELGRAEFVGDSPTAAEAAVKFDAIRRDYEQRYPDRKHYEDRAGAYRIGSPPVEAPVKATGTLAERIKSLESEQGERGGSTRGPIPKSEKGFQTRLARQIKEQQEKLSRAEAGPEEKQKVISEVISAREQAKADRAARQYSQQTEALRGQHQALKNQMDRMVRADELKNEPLLKRALRTAAKAERAMLLGGVMIYPKLAAAAATRFALQPLEQATQSGVKGGLRTLGLAGRIKGLGRLGRLGEVASQASTSGFSPTAEKAALKGAWTGTKQMVKRLKGQQAPETELYGKPDIEPKTWLDYPGQAHSAIKAPVQESARARATTQLEQHARSQGLDPNDPTVRQDIGQVAHQESKRAIFMQDNIVSDAMNGLARNMENSKRFPIGGQLGAFAQRLLIPIVKVPTNIAFEAGSLSGGGLVAGAGKLIHVLSRTSEVVTPEEANFIARHIAKGSIGIGLFATGYFMAKNGQMSGFYQPGKRDEGAVKPMGARIAGVDIDPVLMHAPAFITMNAGATFYNSSHHRNAKGELDQTAPIRVIKGLAEEIPFIKEMGQVDALIGDSYEGEKARGNIGARLVVPQLVREIAKRTDPLQEPYYRAPRNALDIVKKDIPGLREKVRFKGPGLEREP